MPPVLIERFFPIVECSIESLRERVPGIDYPAVNRLHVWFARRPLIASRAAILMSILDPETPKSVVLGLLGIPPDKDLKALHEQTLRNKGAQGKGRRSAFTWPPAYRNVDVMRRVGWEGLRRALSQLPLVLDPMAGGGSIPYEAVRLGLPTIANELNPVAFVVLKATVEYPARFGKKLVPAVRTFCEEVHRGAKAELEGFYPKAEGESVYAYLWARTVKCPSCDLLIPLSPNWWIARGKGAKGFAARLVVPPVGNVVGLDVVQNPSVKGIDPDQGTAVGGDAICPRCHSVVGGSYIKQQAQSDRMGHQVYAVCMKRRKAKGRGEEWVFRAPTEGDIEAYEAAKAELARRWPEWEARGLIPTEEVPEGLKTAEPRRYGLRRWCDFFNPRQLLSHLVYLEKFNEAKQKLLREARSNEEREFAAVVVTYGAMVFDRCVDNNCLLSLWNLNRTAIAHAMGLQGFPFKSSYAEWDHGRMLWPWATEKVLDALEELIELLPERPGDVRVLLGDAARIPLPDKSVHCIVIDPPYYDNVMYGEVSDFFYVWLKRLVGDMYPEAFKGELTNKVDEAVANPAIFRGAPRGEARSLADEHYAAKMEACFREMHRVLKDEGIMCVMFTHRKAEAWSGLTQALINAGFLFTASWPVHTEPDSKFGKAEKGVLKVTVFLVSRKRLEERKGLWEEAKDELERKAQERVRELAERGIDGPDLLVSAYGPVLGEFAKYSEVKDASGNRHTAAEALTIVAEAVNRHMSPIPGADLETLAYVNLLRNFPGLIAEEDFARLTTVFGGNVTLDRLASKGGSGLVEKKGGKVTILTSRDRLDMGFIDPNRPETVKTLIDVAHAALIVYQQSGIRAVKSLLAQTGRDAAESGFLQVLRAIARAGLAEDANKGLSEEAQRANLLLEALGHEPGTFLKKGERITHYA